MLTVSLGCALLIARTTVEHVTHDQVSQSVLADHVLLSSDGGLMPRVAEEARALPGVRQAVGTLSTSVVVSADGTNVTIVPAQAVDAPAFPGAIDLDVAAGSIAHLHGATVAVGDRLARHLGWTVGDRVKLWLGDGAPARLRVVALFRRPLGFGQIVLPRYVAAPHVSDARDDAILIGDAGGRHRDVDAALARLARAHPDVEVLTRGQYLHRLDSEARRQSFAVYGLLGIVVVFAAIAAVNALAVAVSERSRDLELLRLIGATRGQLTHMVRLEVLITVVFATVVGALTAAPGVIAFTYGQTGGFIPAIPAWLWLGLPAVAVFLAYVAIALPLRSALRAGRGSVTAAAE
jgi:putative ABC transport system permease protein